MFGVGRDDFVTTLQAETGHHDVAAVCRRARQRELVGCRADYPCQLLADTLTLGEHALEPRFAPAAVLVVEAVSFLHRGDRRAGKRAEAPGVQVCETLQHRKVGAVQASSRSTGA